jgi:hypothetical protein
MSAKIEQGLRYNKQVIFHSTYTYGERKSIPAKCQVSASLMPVSLLQRSALRGMRDKRKRTVQSETAGAIFSLARINFLGKYIEIIRRSYA